MPLVLNQSNIQSQKSLRITGSKSESNRALILQALFPKLRLHNLSNSDDTRVLQSALNSEEPMIDVHHAGTAMRFLTAYLSIAEHRESILTGSERMQQRPIGILVDALRELGADIHYEKGEGYPPIRIMGKCLTASSCELRADISSQFITALMLIAPALSDGLSIKLKGNLTSEPYVKMTLALLNQIGVQSTFSENVIRVGRLKKLTDSIDFNVESDWSSASYYYSLIALSPSNTSLTLGAFKSSSLQGDRALADIYTAFGVSTVFNNDDTMTLTKTSVNLPEKLTLNLIETPDIAQTIAVTCLGLGMSCRLTGLHTLKIKETDRLVALKTEMEKFGATVHISEDQLDLHRCATLHPNIAVDTYQDHRMAMCFAPLALKTTLIINEADVVSKSYPEFWKDIEFLGVALNNNII